MAKFNTKVVLYFEAPVTNFSDQKEINAAYAFLREQICAWSKAAEKDPNVVILDSVFITKDEDYKSRSDSPVNLAIAERMAGRTSALVAAPKKIKAEAKAEVKSATKSDLPVANTSTPPGKTDLREGSKVAEVKGKAKETKETKVINDPGHIQAMTMEQYKALAAEKEKALAAEKAPAPTNKTVIPAAKVEATEADAALDKIFENLKKTQKSASILSALAKAGKELTLAEITEITGIGNKDLTSWLGQTGKAIKALSKVGRGTYKLDLDKV